VTPPYRIAGASGFWGDRNDALFDQVREGPVDAVMLDYLAEVTMSILRRQMQKDPSAGWARDFVTALAPALPIVVERGIVVIANAGGMNPRACARAVAELARKLGVSGLPIGVVSGDDLHDRLDSLLASGVTLENLDTGQPLAAVRESVLSANAYLGADPIAEALRAGARIVVTGRTTDSALALGPLLHRYGWANDDWNRRAAGIVAGHLLECGGQASGGNFAGGWRDVPRLEELGYPIAEVEPSGDFVLTKHASLGGLATPAVVKEQLLYEIGDPRAYLTPDAIADFTSLKLSDEGNDRVRISGVRGRPAPSELKVSIAVRGGYRTAAALTFVWPDAVARAHETVRILLARCEKLGIELEAHQVDLIGISGAHGPMAPPVDEEPNEVLLRVAVRTRDRENAERFARELAPLVLDGMPGACSGPGFGGRPEPQPIVDFWPALVPRSEVRPEVEVIES
jgi:hypothetical protein